MPSRTPMWPRVLAALVPLLLIGGLAGWWLMGRDAGHYLKTTDARGIQSGDAVVRSGVRVGQVVGVKADRNGALVEFRLDPQETLLTGDLVRIKKGLLSAKAEIEVTRGCEIGARGTDPEEVSPGRVLEEASRTAVLATEARCSAVGRRLGTWLQDVELDQAVAAFRQAVGEAAEWSGEAREGGSAFLREQGEDLARKLEESGLRAKADSLRTMMRERLERE